MKIAMPRSVPVPAIVLFPPPDVDRIYHKKTAGMVHVNVVLLTASRQAKD